MLMIDKGKHLIFIGNIFKEVDKRSVIRNVTQTYKYICVTLFLEASISKTIYDARYRLLMIIVEKDTTLE